MAGRQGRPGVDSGHGHPLLRHRTAAAGHAPGAATDGRACRGSHHLRRADRAAALPGQGRPEEGARGLQVRRRSASGPVPRQRRALHHPPHRRGGPVRRVAPGRAGPDGRADARRDGGLRHHQGGADRALRCTHRRTGGRPDQAGQAAVQHPRGEPGGVFPQDAAGDVAGRARHPGQAGRPAAQHAHHAGHGPAKAPAHCRRDAGHLRPHRPPPGPEPDLPRTAGAVVPASLPLAPRRALTRAAARTRPPTGHRGARAKGRGKGLRHGQDTDRHFRPREDRVLHLPKDARETPGLHPGERSLRLSHHRAQPARVLPVAGCAAPVVQARAGPLQGLRGHSQGQRLPEPAHHARQPAGHGGGVSGAHRSHARRGREGHCRALDVQVGCGRQEGHGR